MKQNDKGFSYVVSAEKIKWWKSIPPEEKLRWLEEANLFLKKAQSLRQKEMARKFRKGEI